MSNHILVDQDTELLLEWLLTGALKNGGLILPFTNEEALQAIGKEDLQRFGAAHGNVQSRIDFACFLCDIPPLGCAADAPFKEAWRSSDPEWNFPVAKMQAAAQTRIWTKEDFQHVKAVLKNLGGQAGRLWKEAVKTNPQKLRAWADSFGVVSALPRIPKAAKTAGQKRVVWTRDELILALDLYLKHQGKLFNPDDKAINELSNFLNKMGKVLGLGGGSLFRNPNGVVMKMMNFRRLDPQFKNKGKVGLSQGNRLEEPVWVEFSTDSIRLAKVVSAIHAVVEQHAGLTDLIGIDEANFEEAAEGKLLTRLHQFRERNKRLIDQCKKKALKEQGHLRCSACNFDFGIQYGPTASHIIDCHHTKPVHTLTEGEKTNIKDLILLCANCHRVVHSSKQWLTLEQLKNKLIESGSSDSGD